MSRKRVGLLVVVAALVLSSAWVAACRPAKTSLDVRGSDTMVNLGAAWAERFMAANAKYSVAVQGGGSGTGATALINKNTDIAQMSRPMATSERENAAKAGLTVREYIVAYDGVAMIVNPANPVETLTIAQLAGVFRGEITNWQQLGGSDSAIVVLARDTASGTHVFVKEHVVQEKGTVKGAEYGPDIQFLSSTQAIHDEVSRNPLAIGYIGLGYLSGNVKALAVKAAADSPGVMPTVATVKDKTYDVSRPLFVYTGAEPTGIVKEYIDYVLGAAGQKIVADLGFVPVK